MHMSHVACQNNLINSLGRKKHTEPAWKVMPNHYRGWGSQKPHVQNKYETKLKFPWRGGGGATQKPTNMGVSMDIFWNYNVDNNSYLLEPIY